MKKSDELANAELNQDAVITGANSIIRIYTGAEPTTTAAARTGTVLVPVTPPSTWSAAASGRTRASVGLPWTATATAAGTMGYFSHFKSDGTTVVKSGTCGIAGSGADMIVDNLVVAVGQTVNILSYNSSNTGN